MKNLLNCHSAGLHSLPISFNNGLYRRIFYADSHHSMWNPFEIAIHPHHVDIKITVLEGLLINCIYEVNDDGGCFKKFRWNSHILNGNGGFECLGEEKLMLSSELMYLQGESVYMRACELHTVQIPRTSKCVWLIEEEVASCDYFPINYSPYDLTSWTPEGLYIEVDDSVKERFIGKYLSEIS